MSEAELHTLRARLDGGIRHKATRGALRRGLPVGFVYGDTDGEVRFHPDAAVTGAIRAVFDRVAELGLRQREQQQPRVLSAEQRERLQALGADLRQVC